MNFALEIRNRVKEAQETLSAGKIDALYVSNPKNVLYLTGRESGRILLTEKKAYLWVRDIYTKVYRNLYNSKNYPFEVGVYEDDSVEKKVKSLKCRTVGVEDVSVGYFKSIRKRLKCKLKATSIVEEQRAVKTEYEISMLKKSASIASGGMKKAYKVVRKGVIELDAVAEIEHAIRKLGSETPPFNEGLLLASGSRGANIHANASTSRIKRGLVVVDLGGRYKGYYSDMTRTIPVGKLNKKEGEMMEFIHNIELESIDMIQPGVKACGIHDFIESELEKKGFKFHHAAGHGVGLEIHENPRLGPKSKHVFKENMVFTVEPGIYIPGKFGIRFEDMVLLTKKGCKILTK